MDRLGPICLILLLLGCERTAAQASAPSKIASPVSTPSCFIYNEIYPATEAAFKSQHVTIIERKEIEQFTAPLSPAQERLVRAHSLWATPPSASEQHLIRWMRDPYAPGGVLVFVARPMERTPKGYSPWVALNTNLLIDTRQCSIGAYPGA